MGDSSTLRHLLLSLLVVLLSISAVRSFFGRLMIPDPPDRPRIKRSPDLPLRFNHDGTFKILQVADMHYARGIGTRCRDVTPSEFAHCSDLNTTRFLRRMIESEKPDFIAFTGDNIFGSSSTDAAESMFAAFGPAMEARIPWAAILGNHDQESTMSREELMLFISLMDYSVSQVNPPLTSIDGFGNYDLRVNGAFGSDLVNSSVLGLYFLDSGDRSTVEGVRGYGWIKESQLAWLRGASEALQNVKLNNEWNTLHKCEVPALTFFHIPIPEVRQLWFKEIVGQFQEAVACTSFDSGVLHTLVSMGDVKAVLLGHDHLNDFCGEMDGIWFCYGGGFGYHAYGRAGWHRRARVVNIELKRGEKTWLGVQRIQTWKRLDDANLTKFDEQVLWDVAAR
ncbi:putative inactive purple acid phosphatase 28 [Acorus calamus]|uniref:Inactive purple acid phosphatase 28 n=1 Tax=Acorus calamus TaxID=4465 RepID=A0AAV9ERL2_ACOCL|nr:putative inactive purple acid phosphatase 28 [Acorus calamus]